MINECSMVIGIVSLLFVGPSSSHFGQLGGACYIDGQWEEGPLVVVVSGRRTSFILVIEECLFYTLLK